MSSTIFLTCFLACTFSFIFFAVFGVQIGLWLTRRWFKKNGEKVIKSALGSMSGGLDPFSSGVVAGLGDLPSDHPLREILRQTKTDERHVALTARCTRCEQSASRVGLTGNPAVDETMLPGWKYAADTGWECSDCAKTKAA